METNGTAGAVSKQNCLVTGALNSATISSLTDDDVFVSGSKKMRTLPTDIVVKEIRYMHKMQRAAKLFLTLHNFLMLGRRATLLLVYFAHY